MMGGGGVQVDRKKKRFNWSQLMPWIIDKHGCRVTLTLFSHILLQAKTPAGAKKQFLWVWECVGGRVLHYCNNARAAPPPYFIITLKCSCIFLSHLTFVREALNQYFRRARERSSARAPSSGGGSESQNLYIWESALSQWQPSSLSICCNIVKHKARAGPAFKYIPHIKQRRNS